MSEVIRKRIGIFVICFALVTSYLLGGAFVKKNEAHAEVVADWAIGKVLDATLNVVNGVFLKLMGEAIDNTENETLKNIEQFVVDADNLFLAGEADHSSEQILEELNSHKQPNRHRWTNRFKVLSIKCSNMM